MEKIRFHKYPNELISRVIDLKSQEHSWTFITDRIRKEFDISVSRESIRHLYRRYKDKDLSDDPKGTFVDTSSKEGMKQTIDKDSIVLESYGPDIKTVEDAMAFAEIDEIIWKVDRCLISTYSTPMKIRRGGEDTPISIKNYQIKIWLKRVVSEAVEDAVGRLLERLEEKSPKLPLIKRTPIKRLLHRHSLEMCLMDPHYGMTCFTPGSDANWSPAKCAEMVLDTFDELLKLSEPYAPFEEIVLPFGNDFFHTDSIWQTTTGGTLQPEAEAYYHTFIGGEALAIEIVNRVKKVAPVIIYSIPGNHDRTTSFMLGRLLKAYFRNDDNVIVHADESPYKFHKYGINLIGYEHGHSIKPPIRLAALMANECPEWWAATKNGYREWHLGDQHRKGSAKPTVFEEQGVSVEFLPSLTVPNEWHKLKSYNWQKRSTMAFIWDYSMGPIARLQVNVDRYLNELMGRTRV